MNLEEWIVSETPISVQGQLITPDVTCVVAISSTGEAECNTPTDMVTMSMMTESSALPLTGIVAGIIVCIAVLIIIVTLVVVTILVQYRRKSSSFKLQGDLQ